MPFALTWHVAVGVAAIAGLRAAPGHHPLPSSKPATVSNVLPRRTTDGQVINAHAGGIYRFNGTYYLIGEHYKSCPHAGGNRTKDPLAVGNCEICGHTGSSFAMYTSPDLEAWTMKTKQVGRRASLPLPPLSRCRCRRRVSARAMVMAGPGIARPGTVAMPSPVRGSTAPTPAGTR